MSAAIEPGPEIHPSVVFLIDLLRWVREGRIAIAEFQRGYVWSRSDILNLFDSVKASYPIGTLLFWTDPTRTSVPKPPWRLGPIQIERSATENPMLVLDGQQRLTTLAGVLLRGGGSSASLAEDRDPNRWEVYFDAAEDRFTHLPERKEARAWQVPVSALVDTMAMFRAVSEIQKLTTEGLPERETFGSLGLRLQSVARALQSYRLPIVEFRTSDLNLAVESFTRLNRRGVSIGPDEMFTALIHEAGKTAGFDISRGITAAQQQLTRVGFGDVERLVILRTFLVIADLDPYRTDWKRIGEEKQRSALTAFPDAMRRATNGLRLAVDFLREEGIGNTKMLPYGVQLLGIGAWFAENPSPSEDSLRVLRRWLWLTAFSAWFGQGNPSRYARLFKEMVLAARAAEAGNIKPSFEFEQLPWSTPVVPFPKAFDFRSARARAWLCVMVRRGTVALDGTEIPASKLAKSIQDYGPTMLRRIVAGKVALQSSPANRIFDVFNDSSQAQARVLLRGKDIPTAFWERHQLDPEITQRLASADVFERCLEVRLRRMMGIEIDFLRKLDLTAYENDSVPVDTPIDADDSDDDLNTLDDELEDSNQVETEAAGR